MKDKLILKQCDNCKKDFSGSTKQSYCKRELCKKSRSRIKQKKYRNSVKGKVTKEKNKEHISKKNKLYREKNRDKLNIYLKKWRKENPEASKKFREENPNYDKEWRLNNPVKAKAIALNFARKERATNPQYKIKQNVARRIRELLGSKGKGAPTETLLGCTIKEFKLHLEKQFLKRYGYEFNWKDYNHETFHIDHIRPCASFDLTNEKELLECFNYMNQEILTARENMVKKDKY